MANNDGNTGGGGRQALVVATRELFAPDNIDLANLPPLAKTIKGSPLSSAKIPLVTWAPSPNHEDDSVVIAKLTIAEGKDVVISDVTIYMRTVIDTDGVTQLQVQSVLSGEQPNREKWDAFLKNDAEEFSPKTLSFSAGENRKVEVFVSPELIISAPDLDSDEDKGVSLAPQRVSDFTFDFDLHPSATNMTLHVTKMTPDAVSHTSDTPEPTVTRVVPIVPIVSQGTIIRA